MGQVPWGSGNGPQQLDLESVQGPKALGRDTDGGQTVDRCTQNTSTVKLQTLFESERLSTA